MLAILSCNACLSYISNAALVISILLSWIWIVLIFKSKSEEKDWDYSTGYKVKVYCQNCDFEKTNNIDPEYNYTKYIKLGDNPCPKCGLYELKKISERPCLKGNVTITIIINTNQK